ncbi:MAG: hypothetical protein ABIJ57_08700 [Pseudomonadota bacterium]
MESQTNQLPSVPAERIVKDDSDPMREGLAFVLNGHAYKVVRAKTRGRYVIKHMGIPYHEAAK